MQIDIEDVPARVLSEARCHLGEGPAYDAGSDTAWWFDILERRLFEAHLSTGTVTAHELPFMASALAYVDDDHQLVVAEDGLYRDLAALEARWPAAGLKSITRIGDCLAPSSIADAIHGGHRYAREFDNPLANMVPRRERPVPA